MENDLHYDATGIVISTFESVRLNPQDMKIHFKILEIVFF